MKLHFEAEDGDLGFHYLGSFLRLGKRAEDPDSGKPGKPGKTRIFRTRTSLIWAFSPHILFTRSWKADDRKGRWGVRGL